jgi:hypothetical protein
MSVIRRQERQGEVFADTPHYPPLSQDPQPSSSDEQRRAISGVLCMPQQVKALQEHLVAMGVTVVLKPFNIDQLVDAIRERLGADRALRSIDMEG